MLLLALTTLGTTALRAQITVIPVNAGLAGGTRVTVNNAAGDQTDPHVSGDLVAYSEISSTSIRYYSFLTGLNLPVPKALTDVDTLSDVSGTRISFSRAMVDRRACMVYDTAANTLTEIAPQVGSQRFQTALGGDTVAFVEVAVGNGEIMVYDLDTSGPLLNVSASADIDTSLEVAPSGDAVVWERCNSPLTDCAIMKSVRTGIGWSTPTIVSDTLYNERHPDTDGVTVVYGSDRPSATGQDIYFQPLAGGIETHLLMLGTQRNPHIRAGVIGFESLPPPNSSDIYVYIIATRTLVQVTDTPVSNELLSDIDVLPNGDIRVVWAADDGLAGELNIYAQTFTPPSPYKYVQSPDLVNGLDLDATFSPPDPITLKPWVLAENFPCANSDPITDIVLWGSWLNDRVDSRATYTLSIWSDVPGAAASSFSHPGARLWSQTYTNGQYTLSAYTNLLESFYTAKLDQAGYSTNLYQIWFHADPTNTFFQTGSLTTPTNYWLSVSVESVGDPDRYFGWKSSAAPDNVSAVASYRGALYPAPGDWFPLQDLQGHVLNLAFGLISACPPPVLLGPVDATVECGAPVTLTATAIGNGSLSYQWYYGSTPLTGANGPSLTLSAAHFSDAGPYTVVVTDVCGSVTSAPPAVLTVQDTSKPVLSIPGHITTIATSAAGATVTFQASALDACAGDLPVVCTPPSGSTFPIGVTTVKCVANDGNGNVATRKFSITVLKPPRKGP